MTLHFTVCLIFLFNSIMSLNLYIFKKKYFFCKITCYTYVKYQPQIFNYKN